MSSKAVQTDRRSWDERVKVTLCDVAKEAGVSQSAASVVLNGARSGTRVSAEKQRSVREAAQRMGYRPNSLARSLITGRTHRIGFYSSALGKLDSRSEFYAELLGGVFEGASALGVNTTVHTSGCSEERLLDLVSSKALDGLILHAIDGDPIVPLLSELRMPAVAVVDSLDSLPSVVVDDHAGGTFLAQHLANLGHRHVLMAACNSGAQSGVDRIEAFKSAAARLGIRWTQPYPAPSAEVILDLDSVRTLTEGEGRATAVVCRSDYFANIVCRKLIDLGVHIPETVAVVGFDGFPQTAAHRFSLTTIRANWARVGFEAT